MSQKLSIGVDFGGTKINSGIVDIDTGNVLHKIKKKTKSQDPQFNTNQKIENIIQELLFESNISIKDINSIGIGIAGMVDRQNGILLEAANIGQSNIKIAKTISSKFDKPVFLANDLEAATTSEIYFGTGLKADNFICIFVGTGIGSGIVINKKLYLGHTGTAGEIGHINLIPNGIQCGCGNYGCLEAYASRQAISKKILKLLNSGYETSIEDKIELDKGILRSKAINDACLRNDAVVIKCLQEASRYMAIGLSKVINLLNPQIIVLGGGLIESCEYYFENVVFNTKEFSLKIPIKKTLIVKSSFGDMAGIIGSACLSYYKSLE